MRDEEKVCEGNFSYEVSGGSKYVSDDSLLEDQADVNSDESNQKLNIQSPINFTQSLVPGIDVYTRTRMIESLMKSKASAESISRLYSENFRQQISSMTFNIPTFTVPSTDFPVMNSVMSESMTAAIRNFRQVTEQISKQFAEQFSAISEIIRNSSFDRALLPPNIRDYAEEVRSYQVLDFLEHEGIPLFLVPRGRIAIRLLNARDRSSRRQILSNCYDQIIDDCAAVLEEIDHQTGGKEIDFTLDALHAMKAGYHRSAQAMFTVTLDTLIYRFYPDKNIRRSITNRTKDQDVPSVIDEMDILTTMVWLPIWNAHLQFWKHKGDQIPYEYSRHASVHGVSAKQFSKRNCVQVLMLVTSLLGYKDIKTVGDLNRYYNIYN